MFHTCSNIQKYPNIGPGSSSFETPRRLAHPKWMSILLLSKYSWKWCHVHNQRADPFQKYFSETMQWWVRIRCDPTVPSRILQQKGLGLSLMQHPQDFEKKFTPRIVKTQALPTSLGTGSAFQELWSESLWISQCDLKSLKRRGTISREYTGQDFHKSIKGINYIFSQNIINHWTLHPCPPATLRDAWRVGTGSLL